ncbi:quinone oxidoreductase family protein [Naasia aerilata]|uniref:Quinone oxidoreductase n=1 Tax=Naasia aerilata TaxID=1162966 RepID=A0ABN6XM63_9MICO|nr:quinone oxidoreductase [Naasia aerilata]BDZ45273.1 quinone oxidoreductase [Naasia aerilata]
MPRAIVAEHSGGPEVLQVREVDQPRPGPGEVLIRIAAAGVNFVDVYHREARYPTRFPFTPGSEAAGTVVAAGPGVQFREGDRVASGEAKKTYAEYAILPAEKAVAVPDGVDDRTAAALLLQGFTAHYLCTSTFPVGPEHTVLLHAGAGGVGLLLTQLLKARGARVITTAGSDEKVALSRAAGADEVLHYDGFADHVRELTGQHGVNVVFDGVGKDTFDDSLGSLAVRGMLVLFGAASGPVPPVDPQRLAAAGSVFLTRPTLNSYLRDARERQWRAGELFDAVQAGRLSVRIGRTYPLAEAAQAHEDLQARRTTGKVLLLP